MKRYLFDSGILSAYIDHRLGVRERARLVTTRGDRIGTGIPILAELAAGIEGSSSREKNLAALRSALPSLRLWPFDQDAAFEYGRLFGELLRIGRPMQTIDIMAAAIALTLGNTIVVTTDSDLSAVPGLTVENWAVQA